MTVTIKSASGAPTETFKGDSTQLVAQLLSRYPWAAEGAIRGRAHDPSSLRHVLDRLSQAQDLFVEFKA